MTKVAIAGAGVAAAAPFLGLFMVMMTLGAGGVIAASSPLDPEPSELALGDIPPILLDAYRAAGRTCPGLPWTVLAGIGKVESDHGRYRGATMAPNGDITPPILGIVLDGTTPGTQAIPVPAGGSPWHDNPRWDRALGPMQFLTATFQTVGVDGNQDGTANPHNAIDAIWSAAAYLCPTGEITNIRDAIFPYNRSDAYVSDVLEWARQYAALPIYAGANPLELIAHPNVAMGDAQRADLETGRIDPQLVAILLSVAQDHQIYISSLITGHSICVARTGTYPNCTVSRHASGRAADIWRFDGAVVADNNDPARQQLGIWHAINRETDFLRPWSIGHPFGDLAGTAPGSFNDTDHEDHFHLGVLGGITTPEPSIPALPEPAAQTVD